jgi:hypothetical protein
MSCRDESTKTPGGLHISVNVESTTGRCKVPADASARHILAVSNRSLIRYSVSAKSECEGARVRFSAGSTISDTSIYSPITVGPRPGSGGALRYTEEARVTSAGPDPHQVIRSDITWTPVGWSVHGYDSLYIEVATQ